MVLMPGSPRPARDATEDDGVYRSIFQQPLIEIPPSAPSYAWFEFLLHPEALQRHLAALRQQNARGAHGATSAIELVREFLDQAQLVADEGNVRNKRHRALLRVAAQVALQMNLPLATIERALPLHFQRLLLDGIVDLTESPSHTAYTADITLTASEARLLHHRWALRAMVSQSQNGYLTSSTRSDADELMSGFQLALGDLMASHATIAASIQAALRDDAPTRLSPRAQLDAFMDLGVYFFSFSGYEKAYECLSRASELVDDDKHSGDHHAGIAPTEQIEALEGYLAACEAVLEARSRVESNTLARSPTAQLELAWEARAWDRVVALLQTDAVAYELAQLPPGYRVALEQRALQLLSGSTSSSRDDPTVLRRLYKRIALSNALQQAVAVTVVTSADSESSDSSSASLALDACGCTVVQLLQEEIFYAASSAFADASLFADLARFVLELAAFLFQHVAPAARAQLQLLLQRFVRAFPSVAALDGAASLLAQCKLPCEVTSTTTTTTSSNSSSNALAELLATESRLCAAADRQRAHLRCTSDLAGVFAFEHASDRDALLTLLQRNDSTVGATLAAATAGDAATWRNVLAFCMLHSCWDALAQWHRTVTAAASGEKTLRSQQLAFAVACGALAQFQSTFDSSNSSSDADSSSTKSEFSILASNKLVADVLLKRRQVLESSIDSSTRASESSIDADDSDAALLLLDLPLWLLETLVSIAAGLLHRAAMRNICDYRISFELTPYGDLAFLQAFAPETPRRRDGSSSSSNNNDDDAVGSSNVSTAPFIKSFQSDLVALHSSGLACLAKRCAREPRWHCARADIALNPIVKQKLSATSDPHAALRGYLVAASLATNFFADATSVVDIIDQSSLVRLSQCLVKVGAHVAAAVLYQCFASDEFKYGLRILQLAPERHDDAFFQYFWEMPFLELLVHVHSSAKHYNSSHVTLLTHLIQSPELNSSNPTTVLKSVEQRILRCYFRDLCRLYLS